MDEVINMVNTTRHRDWFHSKTDPNLVTWVTRLLKRDEAVCQGLRVCVLGALQLALHFGQRAGGGISYGATSFSSPNIRTKIQHDVSPHCA